jgi:hypothetical protein
MLFDTYFILTPLPLGLCKFEAWPLALDFILHTYTPVLVLHFLTQVSFLSIRSLPRYSKMASKLLDGVRVTPWGLCLR